MSRAQVAGLVDLLAGLTLTDTALAGGSLALLDRVRAAPQPDDLPRVRDADGRAEGTCYVEVLSADASSAGLLTDYAITVAVVLVYSVAKAEAILCGSELLRQMQAAVTRTGWAQAHRVEAAGWRAGYDAERGVGYVAGTVRVVEVG